MLKIALAGFSQGYYAVEYLRYLSKLKGIEVAVICDLGMDDAYVRECAGISAHDFADELQAFLCHSYENVLDLKPDALLLCSETKDHGRMAMEAVKAGIHTFVSKPLGFSFPQIRGLNGLKREGVCLLCGNPLKYEQGIVEFHDRIQGGEIGKVYSIRIMLNHLAMTRQHWERDRSKSGGPLGTYGVYLFDLARWITGYPIEKMAAFGGNYATPEIMMEDTVKIAGIQAGGGQCSLELYAGIRHEFPFIQIEAVGTKGTLITNYGNYTMIGQTEKGAKLGTLRNTDMTMGEMNHFLDCILHKEAERCSLEDMIYVTRCIDAAFLSIKEQKIVHLERGE